MRIIFLGTGTSTGVPEIGCRCRVCSSPDPRDKRLRTSAMVKSNGRNILIDCGPDFRQQMLAHNIDRIDAVLITHEHYDHVGGLDDLRPFCADRGMDVYAEEAVLEAIRTRMPYAFREHRVKGLPELSLHAVGDEPFFVADEVEVTPVRVMHGCLPIVGFRIGEIAYLTDISNIPDDQYKKLNNLRILAVDALRKRRHLTHQTLEEALMQIERIGPELACLIHISHHFGLYSEENVLLPKGVQIGYDGLSLSTDDTT